MEERPAGHGRAEREAIRERDFFYSQSKADDLFEIFAAWEKVDLFSSILRKAT
jgi:hypothetical protein